MNTSREMTDTEKRLFKENKMLKEQLKDNQRANTVLLDLMTYNDLLMKARKYDEKNELNNLKSVDFSFLESRFNEGGK